jgi:hypothetical protein
MTYIWSLTVGDPSGDGHYITRTETFKSNYDLPDVVSAYEAASTAFQLALTKECQGYEDTALSASFLARYREVFANNQYALDALIDDWEPRGIIQWFTTDDGEIEQDEIDELRASTAKSNTIHIGWPSYIEMYLQIAKLVMYDLTWNNTSAHKNNKDIGGYGLLST